MKPRFRAVLFDLDGTLADTLEDLADAVNHALAALGCPTHPLPSYRYFVGDGARNLMLRTLPADKASLADKALALMRAHYDAHCFDKTRLYPGIPELVSSLRGLKLAVFSNKPDTFTKRMVAHFFPDEPFAAVRGQLPNQPLKPDPSVALQIAGELGIPPCEWLYLGDTNTDMRTALAAGMFAVGALWGFRDREELIKAGAQELVAHPEDVLRLL
ncbi:MAG: HAD family hydrolase [Verrucomicrobia bacterium]|nr:HAD family hydrolase [Verrucomicrobiota bacterium]